jgi:hypothetical protein
MGSVQAVKIGAIPENLYRYTDACAPAGMSLTGWVNSNLQGLISVYNQLCGESGLPAGLDCIVGQVAAQASAAHATDTRVAEVGRAIEEAGTGTGPVDGPRPTLVYTVASEALVTAEMRKLQDQGEYEAGARLAKLMAETGSYTGAAQFLAQHAGNPFYTAGLLNNLNAEQLATILPDLDYTAPLPSDVARALYTAMADGTLSPQAMHELVLVLTSPDPYSFRPTLVPLLEMIAGNRDVSARLVTSMNGNPALVKDLVTYGALCGNENAVLRILANAIYAAPSQKAAITLIKSLIPDLSVLSSGTISQSNQGLLTFMNAAVSRLIPEKPIRTWEQLNSWEIAFQNNMAILTPLEAEIGRAFQDHADNVAFARGLAVSVALAFFPEALPEEALGGGVLAGVLAKAGDGSLDDLNDEEANQLLNLVFGAPEDGAQAETSINHQLQAITMASGIVAIYRRAGDSAGATALIQDPGFRQFIHAVASGEPVSPFESWLVNKYGPVPDGGSLLNMLCTLGYLEYSQGNTLVVNQP